MDARLGAAGDDDVGAAEAEQVQAPADRLGAGRAGADRRVHAALRADLEADRGGRAVGHEHRDGERGDPLGALLLQDVVLAEQGQRAADAGADDDGEPLRVDPGVAGAGVAQASWAATSATCWQRSSRRARTRSSSSVGSDRQPGDELGREVLDPVVGDPADPGPAGEQRLPGGWRRPHPAGWWRRAR